MIHRNELIDPKFFARMMPGLPLWHLTDEKHVDFIGTGSLLVRRAMTRGKAPEVRKVTARLDILCGTELAAALTAGNCGSWGTPYHHTARGEVRAPTYNFKARRWEESRTGVWFSAGEDLPELLLADHFVWALWPWLHSGEHQLRWDGVETHPAILCSAPVARAPRVCYPGALVMPMRPQNS